jgi:uncharacterized membrane protein
MEAYVKWSADDVDDVPPPVTTVMSTVPVAVDWGIVAIICVPLLPPIIPVNVPNFTAVAPAKFVPVIMTVPPPTV